jgi:hypothetical protein
MTRPGKMAGVLALLAALLLGSAAPAQNDSDTGLKERLRKAEDEIGRLKRQLQLLDRDSRDELNRTADRLDRIERALEKMVNQMSARRAFAFDPERVPARGFGGIRLDNRLGVTAFVTIDGETYRVPPMGIRTLRDQPVGLITYSVRATGYGLITPPTRTDVNANETLTLTIR